MEVSGRKASLMPDPEVFFSLHFVGLMVAWVKGRFSGVEHMLSMQKVTGSSLTLSSFKVLKWMWNAWRTTGAEVPMGLWHRHVFWWVVSQSGDNLYSFYQYWVYREPADNCAWFYHHPRLLFGGCVLMVDPGTLAKPKMFIPQAWNQLPPALDHVALKFFAPS